MTRRNLTEVDVEDKLFLAPAAAFKFSETHGGDDVAIFAKGPMAHLFHSSHDQTHIANVMAFSACIGPYKNHPDRCKNIKNILKSYFFKIKISLGSAKSTTQNPTTTSSSSNPSISSLLILTIVKIINNMF